jgi:hypothetical protein
MSVSPRDFGGPHTAHKPTRQSHNSDTDHGVLWGDDAFVAGDALKLIQHLHSNGVFRESPDVCVRLGPHHRDVGVVGGREEILNLALCSHIDPSNTGYRQRANCLFPLVEVASWAAE